MEDRARQWLEFCYTETMYLPKQSLWTVDYPRSRYEGTVLGNLEDWPTSYSEVEQAFGCALKDQPRWMQKHPLPWRNNDGTHDHKGSVVILMCEFLRLREAPEQAGARSAYLLRTGIPMGDDLVQAFMDIEPEPASLFRQIIDSLKSNEPRPAHREHALAFDYQWLDNALYYLDKEMGREREERVRIDLDQNWGTQMGQWFGPTYQAWVEGAQLTANTPQPSFRAARRHGL
jgi:hypothetical protein